MWLQVRDHTKPKPFGNSGQKDISRVPNVAALPALAAYGAEFRSLPKDFSQALSLPVLVRLQFNDEQDCELVRGTVGVKAQNRANSECAFDVHSLTDVFRSASQQTAITATCWQLRLPIVFCRLRCASTDVAAMQRAVQELQHYTDDFGMLQPSFYDFGVRF